MELLITKSELPVFNCLKYTALMEHIDDRHISRETSSQISLARSYSGPFHLSQLSCHHTARAVASRQKGP